jgi:very-short-patch-repair endonuclease
VDFDQFHALRDLGWEVIRFNKEHLRDPEAMRARVARAIARAQARTARPGVRHPA